MLDTRNQEIKIQAMGKSYWIHILASQKNGTLYIGITSDLIKRIWQHKENYSKFTKKYDVHRLVYFEKHESSEAAIRKEKLLKFWKRKWKLTLIERFNPNWEDLYYTIIS